MKGYEIVSNVMFLDINKLQFVGATMKEYTYITLRQKPELKEKAAAWFHDKWKVLLVVL